MGKYEESVYGRSEKQFRTVEEQIGWLSSFEEKPGNEYEKDAVKVAGELQRSLDMISEAESSTSLDELDNLSSEAKTLKFNEEKPLEVVKNRITEVISDKIETSKEITETEEIDIRNIKGLKKVKDQKLKGLESKERAKVRMRLIEEIISTRNVNETEATKIVAREK